MWRSEKSVGQRILVAVCKDRPFGLDRFELERMDRFLYSEDVQGKMD